jgi:hypothetical protein
MNGLVTVHYNTPKTQQIKGSVTIFLQYSDTFKMQSYELRATCKIRTPLPLQTAFPSANCNVKYEYLCKRYKQATIEWTCALYHVHSFIHFLA